MRTEQTHDEAVELRRRIAATLMPGFAGASMPSWLMQACRDGLRSICLYGSNITSGTPLPEILAHIRTAAPRALIAVDEEGGDVTRLHYLTGSPQPGNAVLGRLDDETVTAQAGAMIGGELAALGIHLDLAPVADVNSSPQNPVIGSRSFGDEAPLVARHTASWLRGLQSMGVAACVKHFPGHGDTVADSHLSLPTIDVSEQVLHDRELVPFRAAIQAGAATIMTSHIVVPALDPDQPATFSRRILTDLLRGELGFDGVIVTDALDMHGASGEIGIPRAAVRSLAAGADLLCLGPDVTAELYAATVDAIEQAVRRGALPRERVAEAAARVTALADRWVPAVDAHPVSGQEHRGVDTARIATAFRVNDTARAWLRLPGPTVLVQIEDEANIAVGEVPWGPAAAGAATVSVEQALAADADAERHARVAVVARGLSADHPAWNAVARLRAHGRDVIVIECGWPRDDRADVVAFGASKSVGRAIARVLGSALR